MNELCMWCSVEFNPESNVWPSAFAAPWLVHNICWAAYINFARNV